MATVSYPFDPSGGLASNLIQNEEQTLALSSNGYMFLIPFAGPFFKSSLKVVYYPGAKTLKEGVDYALTHYFKSASLSTAKPIYGSITFFNKTLSGSVKLTYQTIGGEWVTTKEKALAVLTNTLINPRTAYWEQISDLPYAFPPIDHVWSLDDLVGMSEVVDQLAKITAAIKAKGGGNGTSVSDEVIAHLAATNNPHGVNKVQVGLGNVLNYGIASESEAVVGVSNVLYMTPLRVKQAITAGLSGANVIHHSASGYIGNNGEKLSAGGIDDIIIGDSSAPSGTIDTSVVLGKEILTLNDTSKDSVIVGFQAAKTAIGAVDTVVIGAGALNGPADGYTVVASVVIGSDALSSTAVAEESVVIGRGAMQFRPGPNAYGVVVIGDAAACGDVAAPAVVDLGMVVAIGSNALGGWDGMNAIAIGTNALNSNHGIMDVYRSTNPGAAWGKNLIAIGHESMGYACTLSNTIAIGSKAARHTIAGDNNIIIGDGAAKNAQTINKSVLLTDWDMQPGSDSSVVIGIGAQTAAINYKPTNSVMIGYGVGNFNANNPTSAVAVGYFAGTAGIGAESVAVGNNANATALDAVAIGASARAQGQGSIAIGYNTNVIGTNLVSFGSGRKLLIGAETDDGTGRYLQVHGQAGFTDHVFGVTATAGDNSLKFATTAFVADALASSSGAISYDATLFNYKGTANELAANTTGTNMIALGKDALAANTTGNDNVALGQQVMKSATIARFNTGVGSLALYSMTTGVANTAVGYMAGYLATTGSYNVAIGESAMRDNVAAYFNVAVGHSAGLKVNGAYNTLLGNEAGGWMTSGDSNVAVGHYALCNNDTGSNNTALGANANVSTSDLSFATAVGANAYVSTSNTVALGRPIDTVVIGETGASGTAKLQVTGTISATTPTAGDNTTLVATTEFVTTAMVNQSQVAFDFVAGEAIAANSFVHIYNDAGVFKIQNASASVANKEANGFVKSAVVSGATGKVYFTGVNSGLTGLTVGLLYLSTTTAGRSQSAAPTTSGHVYQVLGYALSATSMFFQFTVPTTVA